VNGTVSFGSQYSGTLRGWNTIPTTFEVYKNSNLRQRITLNLSPAAGIAPYSLPLEAGLSGTVTIKVTAPTWLTTSQTLTLGGSENFSLVNGDCNGDNVIDLTDYTVVAVGFNALFGDARFKLSADLDKNGVVDLTDYTIVATNFNALGD
jgi:hypothetical protein